MSESTQLDSRVSYVGKIGPSLAAGIVVAQAAAREVYKGRQSGGEGGPRYKYASTEDVVAVAKEALEKGRLAVLQLAVERTGTDRISTTYKNGNTSSGDELRIRYLLVHESGESVEVVTHTPVIPGPGRPWDKAVAAAETYSMGYALRGVLLLVRTDEQTEPDARDDRDVDAPQPTPRAPARVNDGPAVVTPTPSRAASSEPSNGGAPLPPEIRRQLLAQAPPELHEGPEARDRMLREIRRLIKEIGADHCKELITPLGLPPVAQADNLQLDRMVGVLLAEATRLDNLSTLQWKALAKEIGPDAAGAIATQVSTEPGQAPEDWDWHQLDRAIKAAKRLTAGEKA